MKFKYKTIDTRIIDGIKKAEKLKEQGWKIINNGLFTIQFEKEL